jgi:hypothetical protein
VLPQVLAGLGLVSLVSVGCLLWLQRLQPPFFSIAIGSLLYQLWLVRRRPSALRGRGTKVILAASLMLNVMLIGGWIMISIRYR